MPVAYPFHLDTVQANKSRTQPATFTITQPRSGPGYVQYLSTDTPVIWDVNFIFDRFDAQSFYAWYLHSSYLNRGRNEFTMQIRTEFGLVEHTCQFLPDSLLDHGQTGEVHKYSAQIRSRGIEIPQEIEDHLDLVASEYWRYSSLFDITMNKLWISPEFEYTVHLEDIDYSANFEWPLA